MRILHINFYDLLGGAGKASFRLTRQLKSSGVDVLMVVQEKTSGESYIIAPKGLFNKIKVRIRSIFDNFPLIFYRKRQIFSWGVCWVPNYTLTKKIKAIKPDLAHLHWVSWGYVDIPALTRIGSPIVWTLHDSGVFTGGCHVPMECKRYIEGCGKCPQLGSKHLRDLSWWTLKRKFNYWKDLNITIVSPSNWLAECARKSSVFRNKKIFVIPNGIDTNVFKPIEKNTAREILNLSKEKKYILVGSLGVLDDKNKGFHLLLPALQSFASKFTNASTEILVFGSNKPTVEPNLGLPAKYLGYVNDDIALSIIYSSADLFIIPSIQENFPNTILEAFACGCPCLAFKIGGIPDLIDHKVNGYLAEPFKLESLVEGIEYILDNEEERKRLSTHARKKVVEEFDIVIIGNRYKELYKSILE